jgi:serine/threonine protein kinase
MSAHATTSATGFLSEEFDRLALEEFDHVGGSRLQLGEQIGKTAFASVFRATDRSSGRNVAVKIIEVKPEQDWRQAAARIRREVNTWIQVENNSPYILPLHDVLCHRVRTPDQNFVIFGLIMPFSELGDLKNYMRRNKVAGLDLTATRLKTFLKRIAEAVQALHQASIIHKDIKSSNVLLFHGNFGMDNKRDLLPKLADFGISQKVADDKYGQEGTPEYMAPEMFPSTTNSGEGPSFASDVYALGVLYYEAITGQLPYKSAAATMTDRRQEYEKLSKAALINFNPVEDKMGSDMAALVRAMIKRVPLERPDIASVVSSLDKQIIFAEHGHLTSQGTHDSLSNLFRWNPFVHERLGENLSYYFLKGANVENDPQLICDSLNRKDVVGFSLYRVIGGIDMLLRVWTDQHTASKVDDVMKEFKQLHSGKATPFRVEGFYAINSKTAITFPRYDKEDVARRIFECLDGDRDKDRVKLGDAGIIASPLGRDGARSTHPLRIFIAFQFLNPIAGSTNRRIYAREIYEALMQFELAGKATSISCYWGGDHYSLLVKLRLKQFEDYEAIWNECIKVAAAVHEGTIVQPDTYLELSRYPIRESDDGGIWKRVERYCSDNFQRWPGHASADGTTE